MQCIAENSFILSIKKAKNHPDMAPHCDTMDGPVVKAARRALETGNINLILPWVHKESEQELKQAFERSLSARRGTTSYESRELADLWFSETSVRLHRQGEGAPYTGIKPSGTLESLAVPMADEAIETANPEKVIDFLTDAAKEELHKRFEHAISKKKVFDENNVEAARDYVQAMLEFVLFAGHLYEYIESGGSHGKKATAHTQYKAEPTTVSLLEHS